MNNYFAYVVMVLSLPVYAADKAYDLKFDLSSNGEKLSSPRLIVKEGETGTVTQDAKSGQTFIEVVATESKDHKNAVLMKFVVGTVSADGKRTTVSRPQILAMENEVATMSVAEKGSKEVVSLSVVAKRTEVK